MIYTGDNAPQALWEENLLNYTYYLGKMFSESLPGIPVFPTIGNQETFPANFYDPTDEKVIELNNAFANAFKDLAGWNDEDIETVKRAGYYSKIGKPGLRIIGINSNFGSIFNFYNALNKDGDYWKNMKSFVRNNLIKARNNNEKVAIIGHHATGFDTSKFYR